MLIESSISFPEQGWEAVLWHNGSEDGSWVALPLQEVDQKSEGAPVRKRELVLGDCLLIIVIAVGCDLQRSSESVPKILYW